MNPIAEVTLRIEVTQPADLALHMEMAARAQPGVEVTGDSILDLLFHHLVGIPGLRVVAGEGHLEVEEPLRPCSCPAPVRDKDGDMHQDTDPTCAVHCSGANLGPRGSSRENRRQDLASRRAALADMRAGLATDPNRPRPFPGRHEEN